MTIDPIKYVYLRFVKFKTQNEKSKKQRYYFRIRLPKL